MSRKLLLLMLLALLVGTFNLASKVEKAEAIGTIYIRADGSIDPSTAPVSTINNVTYNLIGNINESIVVERDNIVVDGLGYTVQGDYYAYSYDYGISLTGRTNITINNVNITAFYYGILLNSSSNINLSRNDLTQNYVGIEFISSSNNTVNENNATADHVGIDLYSGSNNNVLSGNNASSNHIRGIGSDYSSKNNSIIGNNVTANNNEGIQLFDSSDNTIVGNNITANKGKGIWVCYFENNTVRGNNVTDNEIGIYLEGTSNNDVIGNNIGNNTYGISLDSTSHNNSIIGNKIANSNVGINVYYSSHNSISGNYITNNSGIGIHLYSASNSSISGNNITANHDDGIYLDSSSRNTLIGNGIISNNRAGVHFFSSSNNSILRNFITTNNYSGIWLDYSSNHNDISGNTITNNGDGVRLYSSLNNTIYHNNIDNSNQAYVVVGLPNVWDNGFEGNYWRDYNGTDADHDGIGDTPYVIDANNTDHYPLMGTFQSFNVSNHKSSKFEEVDIISNLTIGQVDLTWGDDARNPPTYMDWFLFLYGFVGQNGTHSFCRVTFPNDILNSSSYHIGPIQQYLDDNLTIAKVLSSNGTHTTLYFTFDLPSPYYPELFNLIIIPEFPSFLVLSLFMIATLIAVIVYRKKHARISGTP